MRIRPNIRALKRKSFMHKDELSLLYGKVTFSGLNCRGGVRHFSGVPLRVDEFIKEYDWAEGIWEVGDTSYESLKREICRFWSDCSELRPEQIKIGYGSMQVLERINKFFVRPGVKVLGYAPQFIEYVTELEMSGVDYKAMLLDPEKNFEFDAARFLREISSSYSLIYIDNPNNPTGYLIGLDELEDIIREADRKDIFVLIDEAYADYAEKQSSAINLTSSYDNLIVTRTFTKGYQFAGIRVGYGIFSAELSEYYDKVDLPFPIPAVGSYMGKEALLDKTFMRGLKERLKSIKEELIRGLEQRGYHVSSTLKTCPIFLVGCKDEECDLKKYFLDKGILTLSGRDFMNLGKNYVRITVPEKPEEFLSRLE